MRASTGLPAPSADALAHSTRVQAAIRARIEAGGGWIGFADFMQIAMFEPGLGYYSAGSTKFGADGDFVTAPEQGELFGRSIARLARQVLAATSGGVIVEIGGGSGALAAALLDELGENRPSEYQLLEVSGELRQRQRDTIAARVPTALGLVRWLDSLPGKPQSGLLIANEVLDALPVERFACAGGRVYSLGVAVESGRLAASARLASEPLEQAVRSLERACGRAFADGYTSEINLRLPAWLGLLPRAIGNGISLLVDYGYVRRDYYAPERHTGTLACHYRHRFHDDPFWLPGLQDISAWVDFTAVAEACAALGLEIAGFGTQAHLLLGLGIGDQLESSGDSRRYPARAAEARRLLMPGEMGERFKALLVAHGGFRLGSSVLQRDLRASL